MSGYPDPERRLAAERRREEIVEAAGLVGWTLGLCLCGCGGRTTIQSKTRSHRGLVAGEPALFLSGHPAKPDASRRSAARRRREGIIETAGLLGLSWTPGICLCGCGRPTTIQPQTRSERGVVVGEPALFTKGHGAMLQGRPPSWSVAKDGCWLWEGKAMKVGYGRLAWRGERVLAHRWSYEKHVGPIPAGHDIHHRCEVKLCVNPEHLECLTVAEHRRRHIAPMRLATDNPEMFAFLKQQTGPLCAGCCTRCGGHFATIGAFERHSRASGCTTERLHARAGACPVALEPDVVVWHPTAV